MKIELSLEDADIIVNALENSVVPVKHAGRIMQLLNSISTQIQKQIENDRISSQAKNQGKETAA